MDVVFYNKIPTLSDDVTAIIYVADLVFHATSASLNAEVELRVIGL